MLLAIAAGVLVWQMTRPCFFVQGEKGILAVVPVYGQMDFSLQFIHSVQKTPVIENLKVNEKLEPFIVVNKAPSNSKSTEVADSIELLHTLPKFKILNTVIRDRKQFRDASVQGLSVLEMGSSKAKDEFNEFLVEIL
mgnify:CR=1 FL=1